MAVRCASRCAGCARGDFVNTVSAGDLEQPCVWLARGLREEFTELDEAFIQPASSDDGRLRERVRARYGRPVADE